jgi:hypothetical protein
LLLTGIGVFANLWIAFLIFRQSRLIRHQVRTNHISTRASIRSARAAQDNASTVINSERAWVIPELQSPAVDRDGKLYWREAKNVAIAEKDILAGRHLIYTLKITNMGRTPAQILSFKIFYTCLDEGVRDLSPESPVDYAASREFIRLLDTRESIEIDEPKINVHEFVNRYSGSIRKLEKTAVIHGWVKYRHMFSREKTCYADFCYVYTVSRNRLSSVGRHTGQREEIDVPEEEQN